MIYLFTAFCYPDGIGTVPCLLRHLKLVEADFFVDFAEGLSGDVGSFLRTGLVDAVQVSLVRHETLRFFADGGQHVHNGFADSGLEHAVPVVLKLFFDLRVVFPVTVE